MPPPDHRPPSRRRRQFDGHAWAACALVALWVISLLAFIPVGASNTRMVEAFSTDEALQTNLIAQALHAHSWKLRFGAYGHLYLNLVLLPLKILWPVSERAIVETARSISLACGAALLLFTAWWTRRVCGTVAAWLALVLLILNQTVFTWSVIVHPDMLQTLLLMLALYYTTNALDRPTTANVLSASAAAGLAFAAKYSGVFVLPLIGFAVVGRRTVAGGPAADFRLAVTRGVLAVIALLLLGSFGIDADWIIRTVTSDGRVDVPLVISLDTLIWLIRGTAVLAALAVTTPWLWRALRRRSAVATVLWGFGVACATFMAAFAAGSPYSFWRLAFLKGLYYEAMETGAKMNVGWVEGWATGATSAMGWPIVVPATCTAVWLLARHRRARLSAVEAVLLAWTTIYTAVLLAPLHEIFMHYTLPIIVPTAMLAGHGIVTAADALSTRLKWRTGGAMVAAVVVLLLLSEVPGVVALATFRAGSLLREETPPVVIGKWMADRLPASSTVAYDYMSYVPPTFERVAATWGGTVQWLADVNPDLVVVNRRTASAWQRHASEQAYYQCLDAGTCGYTRVLTLDFMAVYQRDPRPGTTPASQVD